LRPFLGAPPPPEPLCVFDPVSVKVGQGPFLFCGGGFPCVDVKGVPFTWSAVGRADRLLDSDHGLFWPFFVFIGTVFTNHIRHCCFPLPCLNVTISNGISGAPLFSWLQGFVRLEALALPTVISPSFPRRLHFSVLSHWRIHAYSAVRLWFS